MARRRRRRAGAAGGLPPSQDALQAGAEVIEGIDATDQRALSDCALRSRPVDLLINNAGLLTKETLEEPNLDAIDAIEINSLAPLAVTHTCDGWRTGEGRDRDQPNGLLADNTSGRAAGTMSKAAANMMGSRWLETWRRRGGRDLTPRFCPHRNDRREWLHRRTRRLLGCWPDRRSGRRRRASVPAVCQRQTLHGEALMSDEVKRTGAQWRVLAPCSTRCCATRHRAAFTGATWNEKRPGRYVSRAVRASLPRMRRSSTAAVAASFPGGGEDALREEEDAASWCAPRCCVIAGGTSGTCLTMDLATGCGTASTAPPWCLSLRTDR